MKFEHFSAIGKRRIYKFVLLFLICPFISLCKEEPQIWELKSQEQLIGQYISNNPEQYSEFEKLIQATGMESLLNIRGPFTLFLPGNDAMKAFYEQKKVNSISDFSPEFLKILIYNHLIGNAIQTGDIGLGAIRDTNALGDFVVTEFEGSDIIINKYARIIKGSIPTANGYIHVIDKVLDPLTKDIYEVVSSDPSYSIFSQGLALTGLKDTLKIISFPYGKQLARTRFTVLAVPDSIYQRNGINNVNDLIGWCGGSPDSLTFLNNPFYRYIEYHCLNGSYYLSDLSTGIYSILSRDNNISMTIDTDYKINVDPKTKQYTGFIVPASNTPAKNGALHAINNLLPVTDPEPATIIFEATDFFDLKQGDYFGKYYVRWFDGENTFAKVKWDGDFLQYYYRATSGLMGGDCLQMIGWWSCSITFPKVMKGKYTISIYQPGWHDVTNCVAYVDGELTPFLYQGNYGGTGGSGGLQKMAEVNFLTTAEHTITLKNTSFGMLFWDYVQFTPVK